MKKIIIKTAAALLASSVLVCAHATAPAEITFSNNTSLGLNTSIAGLPGNGISANETKSVGYGIVTMGCSFGNVLSNCPIEFTDRATGEKVATVRINALDAVLVEPPTFYGSYGDEYEVAGWDANPISHISINKKA